MQKRLFIGLLSLTIGLVFTIYTGFNAYSAETVSPTIDKALKAEIKASIDKGLRYLNEHQEKDGSYEKYPGITALVAAAYMKSPKHYTEKDSVQVKDAIKYLLTMVKPDGGIYDQDLPNYNTSLGILALNETKNSAYKTIIQNAQKTVMGYQVNESGDMYGGIGYSDDDPRPDMSNLKFSLQAMKESGVPKDSEVWAKAVKFIEHCQNRTESNDQPTASDDGGFIYRPGFSQAGNDPQGKPKSYGSMTYAGILSFIYANVDKNDPRVQDAVKWVMNHYTLDENPNMGQQGLFYYYHTMAKAFKAYGEPVITDSDGVKHNWYAELAKKLIKNQKPDGSWVNSEDRWFESKPVLSTAYAILALSIGYE